MSKKLVCLSVAFFVLVLLNKNRRGEQKTIMRCVEQGCGCVARGYDIESAWDEEDQPVWAVYYECPDGHTFIAEYERKVEAQAA
jgi:hypothetical protein